MKERFPPRSSRKSPVKGIRANASTILLLVSVIFFVFAARVIYSPLLPSIEQDLHLSHTQAASFFLVITLGYIFMNLFSGFFSSWFGLRMTIFLSPILVSAATVLIAFSSSLLLMKVGLLFVGAGAGLYPSSGIAMASSLVESRDEGKVLSLHESGPILGFIIAPLIVAMLMPAVSWRGCLLIIAALGVVLGTSFAVFSRGGDFRGKAPVLRNVTRILALPSFWIIALFMALGAGSSIGLYSVIPTYLVFERGLDHGLVNTLVGVSRISGLIALWFSGFLVDKYGAKVMICLILLSAGVATVALGARSQALLVTAVFLQPLLIVSFFPAVLTASARIAPRNYQNLTVSLMLSIGYGIGSGLVPLLMGWLGDNASFALGFLMYGVLLVVGSVLPFLLKLEHQG